LIIKDILNGVSWATRIIFLIAVIAGASALWGWFHPKVVTNTEYVNAPVEKIVTKIKRVEVPITKVITYEKPIIVEKLKLPDWLKTDADKQVIANAEIQPYEGKTSAVAILDTKSGEAQIIAKQKPLPFFEFKNEKEIGVRYGYASTGLPEADIYGRWTFARVGSLHSALYVEGNTKPEGKAMVEVSYRWR